jgi:hypothetical protein
VKDQAAKIGFAVPADLQGCSPSAMCGRITQKSNAQKLGLGLATVSLIERLQAPPRFYGAPGQDHFEITACQIWPWDVS